MLPILSKYRYAAYFVGFLAFSGAVWTSGYRVAAYRYQAETGYLKTQYANEAAERERQHTQSLQAALNDVQKWQDFAQKQGVQLAQAQQKLDAQTAQINKEISHVIQKDNSNGITFNGLGDDSLRLYRQALGYSD
ncbi:MAG: hypothetical protein Q4B82_08430 [Alysiella sp.]|uniref:hypothetical protein n=1 Tax=Alysiella sp. TaxID=1872483 RepID=UPI0026DC99BE|nr:hypothetical protein [Alysiella sp.]MDO4434588.1 hypothetical protein [Alysiella sp.]